MAESRTTLLNTQGTEVSTGTTIKKHMIGLFLDVTGSYKRIKKSTTLEIAVEANTEEQDFIADMTPTELLKNYKVSLSQDLSMIKGEEDFEYIWEKFYNAVANNEEVNTKCLMAFMFDGDKTAGYKAWETNAKIVFENLNGVDSKINFSINFGDIRKGLAKVDSSGVITFEVA